MTAVGVARAPARTNGRRGTAAREYDVEAFRREVLALAQRVHRHPLVYLDAAATTQRPESVLEAMSQFYRRDNANSHQPVHELGTRAKRTQGEARRTVAKFLNAEAAEEVVWVRGTTEGINIIARTWAQENVGRGDNIVLTIMEHFSNLVPWQQLAKRTGAELRFVDVDADGRLRLDQLEQLLTRRTRLVAVSHVSNATGMIYPVEQIAEMARGVGARVLVDAAQSAPHLKIDVQAMGCDFLAFSGHKLGGPFGMGALWARLELLEQMTPHQFGGGAAEEATPRRHKFKTPPESFEAGSGDPAGALGLATAIERMNELGQPALWRYEQSLVEHALERLGAIDRLELLGSREAWERVPLFTFSYKGLDGETIARRLNERGIAVSGGNLSAQPLLARFGLETAARASCWIYNTAHELDRLVDGLEELRA